MALVIPIFIPHRGCPHQCLFCNQKSITGQESGGSAEQDIAQTVEEWLIRSPGHTEVQVAFYGGSFSCLDGGEQIRMLSAVQPFIGADRVTSIRLSTRPDCIDDDVCALLKEFGVSTVELGVQSLNDLVLERSERGHTADQSKEALRLLKEAGMEVGVQLMVGLPLENTVSFISGVDEVIRLQPDFVRMYPVVVVKHSGLEKLFRQKKYQPLSLNKAVALTAKGYMRFQHANIPVVRMGLQPSDSLTDTIVSGPHHPSFGELVKSRIWFNRLRKKLVALGPEEKLDITVSHRDLSMINGMKKNNIKRLVQLGFGGRFSIMVDKSMERGSVKYAFGQ